ncbi:hypothetical protein ASE04_22165 [Rhizobium sp. Root708]|uniref:hypothetical protein n=1 Tax=Rhizobium sp. Root708 TaxID=1736592 RepID=UPI0007020CD6|nr:hypothetical protein [Rhizobium sp. Root708]KRB61559.1 hypothetical protein ASE04_22165 [Rhizobium sp. Root708]
MNNAIAAADADGDANATITLTGSFAIGTTLTSPTKPIIIDTRGFTMGGVDLGGSTDKAVTFSGTIVGATGQRGFLFDNASGLGTLLNNGSITGGAGTATPGTGVYFNGPVSFVNNGSVTGGSSTVGGSGLSKPSLVANSSTMV